MPVLPWGIGHATVDYSQNTAACVQQNNRKLRGLAKRFATSVWILGKKTRVSKSDVFSRKGLNALATAHSPPETNSAPSEHHEGVYDSMAGFDYQSPLVHLLPSGFDKAPKHCAWVGSLFTSPAKAIVSRVTVRMRVKQGNSFAFRVIIAEWPVLERGLPHNTRVQSQKTCHALAPLEALYSSEPMLLPCSEADGSFHDVECNLLEDAVALQRGKTILLAIATNSVFSVVTAADDTEQLCADEERQGRTEDATASEAEVGCVRQVAAGPFLQGLLWSQCDPAQSALLHHQQPAQTSPPATPAGLMLLPTVGLEADGQGRAMALKLCFAPAGGEGGRHAGSMGSVESRRLSFTSMPAGTRAVDLPLLLDRNLNSAPTRRTGQVKERVVGSYSDILLHGAFDAARVRTELPLRCQDCNWALLYSTRRHGISINTFFRRVTGERNTVLLVQDDQRNVFGCFNPAEWRNDGKEFYGTGESFVFQLRSALKKYSWTGENSMFIMSDSSGLVVGGGGTAAIWLDAQLDNGGSGQCRTFDSPCLGSGELFKCIHLEVWATCSTDEKINALKRDELLAQMFEWHSYNRAYSTNFRSPQINLEERSQQPEEGKKREQSGKEEDGGPKSGKEEEGSVQSGGEESEGAKSCEEEEGKMKAGEEESRRAKTGAEESGRAEAGEGRAQGGRLCRPVEISVLPDAAAVRDSVRETVGGMVGDTMRDTVGEVIATVGDISVPVGADIRSQGCVASPAERERGRRREEAGRKWETQGPAASTAETEGILPEEGRADSGRGREKVRQERAVSCLSCWGANRWPGVLTGLKCKIVRKEDVKGQERSTGQVAPVLVVGGSA